MRTENKVEGNGKEAVEASVLTSGRQKKNVVAAGPSHIAKMNNAERFRSSGCKAAYRFGTNDTEKN